MLEQLDSDLPLRVLFIARVPAAAMPLRHNVVSAESLGDWKSPLRVECLQVIADTVSSGIPPMTPFLAASRALEVSSWHPLWTDIGDGKDCANGLGRFRDDELDVDLRALAGVCVRRLDAARADPR